MRSKRVARIRPLGHRGPPSPSPKEVSAAVTAREGRCGYDGNRHNTKETTRTLDPEEVHRRRWPVTMCCPLGGQAKLGWLVSWLGSSERDGLPPPLPTY
ncbi:hypothetical protein LY76DRAFT_205162 [Colletotrichum caudatum]|nr:hypothetical protein LY76DRAFT_205162 [Colletotrichum caudatum]